MSAVAVPTTTGWYAEELGEGRPLILLHGIGMSASAWKPILDRLAVSRRVIAFDLPGFGRTPSLPESIEPTPAAIAVALVEELRARGIEPPYDIAGNSLGGYVALEVAKAGLARSVVGVSPAGLWVGSAPRSTTAQLRLTRRLCQQAPGLTRFAMRTGPGRTLSLIGNHSWKGWRVPVEDAIQTAANFGFGDAFERVALAAAEPFRGGQEIDVPVTIAFGRHDMLLRRRTAQYRGELPQSTRWLTLAGCGHVPMWDDPEAVAELVLAGTSITN